MATILKFKCAVMIKMVTLRDGLERRVVDAACLLADKVWLEKDFRTLSEVELHLLDHLTLDKGQPHGHHLFAIVHDEDATDVRLDVVALLLRLEEVERCTVASRSNSSSDLSFCHRPHPAPS